VFLRVLEYYTGILFLTTNRVGDFDEAFASRIHVSLEYPPLDRPSTENILNLNIRLIRERFHKTHRSIEIDELGINESALNHWETHRKARLNGRQIRNACQTALALAEFEAQGGNHEAITVQNATVNLYSRHFDTVLKAYLAFNKYLKDIYGTSSEEHAGELGLRAREKTPRRERMTQSQPSNGDQLASSFPGAHFYQQNPHMPMLGQQGYAASQHPLQSLPIQQQQSYSAHMVGQQNFAVPMQGPTSALAGHQVQAFRNAEPQVPITQPGYNILRSHGDMGSGHDAPHQPL
jgi:hypothetical protein